MRDYSLVILVGKLSDDPKLTYTANGGMPCAHFTLSVKKMVGQPDGSMKENEALMPVTVWRHQAEIACQFLKKGSTAMVVGQVQQHVKKSKNGKRLVEVEIVADRIQFLDKKVLNESVAPTLEGGS